MKSGISREKLLNGLCSALECPQAYTQPLLSGTSIDVEGMSEKLRANNHELPRSGS